MKYHPWMAVALAGFSTLCSAQAMQPLEQRWELGLEFGRAEQAISHGGDNQIDESDEGFRVFGSYYFTPSVALRVGYADLGTVVLVDESFSEDFLGVTEGHVKHESSPAAVTVGGVFALPINQLPVGFALEAGLIHWELDYEVTENRNLEGGGNQRLADTYNSSGVGYYGGVNVTYQFTPAFGVGASALWYAMEPEIDGDDDFELMVQTLNLNALMRF